jgi:hypothetical protein
MSYAGGRSAGGGGGGPGLDDEDVPAEDSELTWQGSQSTIMAELARHRELAAAASLCAASSAGKGGGGGTGGEASEHSALEASRGEQLLFARQLSVGAPATRSSPRPHSASVIQVRGRRVVRTFWGFRRV